MVSEPLVFLGALFFFPGLYVYWNADDEFDRSMWLKGVDPDGIDSREQRSAVRRNRLVAVVCVVFGAVGLVSGFVL